MATLRELKQHLHNVEQRINLRGTNNADFSLTREREIVSAEIAAMEHQIYLTREDISMYRANIRMYKRMLAAGEGNAEHISDTINNARMLIARDKAKLREYGQPIEDLDIDF